ncbi:hypothetical protein OG592_40555 [Streptomyces avidinii]|uniref:hypothetical protein n=1 Tax=Streptomyces avidinii TaxID=1895 RepID=UPI00386A399C|nr:hypothetical protein OG592_00250 [Streptomyces avidinii]WST50018.1 hypothetical protein OG592_40555 [Streptomyces avidinii]
MATVMAAAISLSAPGVASAHATPEGDHAAISVVHCAADKLPWLSSYTFDGRLKLEGGCYTINGQVRVIVRLNNGAWYFNRWVTAREHPSLAGGWINVNTGLRAPCTGHANNGYARAYDSTTNRWSPRFPVPVCTLYDD